MADEVDGGAGAGRGEYVTASEFIPFKTIVGEIREDVKNLNDVLGRFINKVDERFMVSERAQAAVGRVNWAAVTGCAAIIGSLALLYIKPIEAGVGGLRDDVTRIEQDRRNDQRRAEEDRRYDEGKFDERLQREMRLLNENTASRLELNAKMLEGRLATDETRLNDITNRFDRQTDEDRRQLNELRMRLLTKDLPQAK